jgi:hypothetical protein
LPWLRLTGCTMEIDWLMVSLLMDDGPDEEEIAVI